MAYKERLEAKIAQAQQQANILKERNIDALLDNPAYIEAQRAVYAKNAERTKLTTIIQQLNTITPFVSSDGSRYKVNVWPVAHFGPGLGEVIGIISNSRSAFTDVMALEYSVITGISTMELIEANIALGSPTYINNTGIVVEAEQPNYSKLKMLLESIMIKMDINEFNLDALTEDKLSLWFTKAELAVAKDLKARSLGAELEAESSQFTMEN